MLLDIQLASLVSIHISNEYSGDIYKYIIVQDWFQIAIAMNMYIELTYMSVIKLMKNNRVPQKNNRIAHQRCM